MSLRDHVMAAMAKHHLHMKSIAAKALTNKTGEAGDEAPAPRNASSVKQSAKHRGFKAVQGKIQAEGYSKKIAGAILAARTRAASASAKHNNPRLLRVKG